MGSSPSKDKAYKRQLEKWISASGLQKGFIADLTKYFQFDEIDADDLRKVHMKPATLSYLLTNRPSNRPGKYNLYALLGVLYTVEVASKDDINTFLNEFGYDKDFPEQLTLHKIWEIIKQGAQECRSQEDLTKAIAPTKVQNKKTSNTPYAKSLLIIFIVLITVGLGLAIIRSFPSSSGSIDSVCSDPVGWTPPEFIRDEGFSHFQSNEENLPTSILQNETRSLGIDTDGIWVGYDPNEDGFDSVSYLNKGSTEWTHCNGLNLAEDAVINDIAFYENTIFFATDGNGIAVLSDNDWNIFTTDHGLASNSTYDIAIFDDIIYAATFEGVSLLERAHWQDVYDLNARLVSTRVHNILDDMAGNRWLGHINGGITQITPNGDFNVFFQDNTGLQNIRGIAEDANGGVWFATLGGGVLQYIDGNWNNFTVDNSELLIDDIYDVEVDRFDRVWVATPDGALYTPDYGLSWIRHVSYDIWDIELGCEICAYDANHIWYVFRDNGLGHSQLPPAESIVAIEQIPERVQLEPGETYRFQVTVRVISENLEIGDGLFNSDPRDTNLYGAFERIPVDATVSRGETYTFSNQNDPIVAPNEPGIYSTTWRVWQNTRYVSEPIVIEFEVSE